MAQIGHNHKNETRVMPMAEDSKKVLSASDVATILEVHPRTVRRWCKLGMLPAMRAGKRGKYMIRKEDLEALNLQEQEQNHQ